MLEKRILPIIKRTRGYLLYDINGKRYLDFYQDRGRAVLGHRLDGMTGVIKSTAAKGLTAAYPSVYSNRIEKQLKLLFPFVSEFRIFSNIERALSAISKSENKIIEQSDFIDFPAKSEGFAYWRPFLDMDLDWQKFKYFIPVLPFPGNFGPVVVAGNASVKLGPSDFLSPMISNMLIKSSAALLRVMGSYNSRDLAGFESPVWNRIGPYLRFKLSESEYLSLFSKALEKMVLLPPDPAIPGIIPFNYEKGQIRGFMEMIRSEYGS